MLRSILSFLLCTISLTVVGQRTLSVDKIHEDFDFLITELKLQHQGLYQYVDSSQVNLALDSIRNTIHEPLTKLDFYQKLRCVIGLTNEAHTSISLPKKEMIKLGLSNTILPIGVMVLDNNLVLTQNFGKPIPKELLGAKILKINGVEIHEILKNIYTLLPTDGFNETARKEWIAGVIFSLLYRIEYGAFSEFKLEVEGVNNKKVDLVLSSLRLTKFKGKNKQFEEHDYDYEEFVFEQVNDSIAYLSVPSFDKSATDFESFYRSSFHKIDSLNITHLIIDVQHNGGGEEGNENLLFSYLSDSVIQKYKRVTMMDKPYQKNKNDEGIIEDKWAFKDGLGYRGDFTLWSDYYSNLGYKKPDPSLLFKGKVYVLTSGLTFSGGAEFSSLVRMTNRGIFIGEETGGTYQGNVSGYSEYVKLPHSKIEVSIPTVHFQINVNPEKEGYGVIPDYTVTNHREDYLSGKNSRKEFAIELIKNKKTLIVE
ncbi:S41 family peptidase [Flammeovirga aprica]|uniref:Tail specific protease domain-containing protein n=1 Tax=Flammeovirga aprica JL-4 TaxID=694437 RepID=A0A7X9XC29_9BACT|nr:S41 family peptidase [Flammeovirga aprica]NME71320.1 hypothetical protein [Flammeovirga aprica JL-4]